MVCQNYCDGAELFLDILTKEEKEALLTKKMEAIRKKNDVIRIRHEEIQADKWSSSPNHKVIETGPGKPIHDVNSRASQSPKKDTRPINGEEIRQRPDRDRSERSPEKRPQKPATGRGKQLARMSKEKLKAQDIRISRSKSDVGQPRSVSFQGDANQPLDRQRSRDSQGSDGSGPRQHEFDSRIFRRHVDKQVTFEDQQPNSAPRMQHSHNHSQPYQRPNQRSPRRNWDNNDENQFPPEFKNNPLLRSSSFGDQDRRRNWDQHDRRGNNHHDNRGDRGQNQGYRNSNENFGNNNRGNFGQHDRREFQRNGFGRGNRQDYDRRDNNRDSHEHMAAGMIIEIIGSIETGEIIIEMPGSSTGRKTGMRRSPDQI
ncbi:hypothetical protein MAR_000018 [Mya arenaria]|uniref:Uncharacterized protein n=1 Tax=Mya arenaria TaxID=6604 RepID=A0ABY7F7T0_MYAAR|nr:hypothetical protein MAR_000018 [Mya arenaria]